MICNGKCTGRGELFGIKDPLQLFPFVGIAMIGWKVILCERTAIRMAGIVDLMIKGFREITSGF